MKRAPEMSTIFESKRLYLTSDTSSLNSSVIHLSYNPLCEPIRVDGLAQKLFSGNCPILRSLLGLNKPASLKNVNHFSDMDQDMVNYFGRSSMKNEK